MEHFSTFLEAVKIMIDKHGFYRVLGAVLLVVFAWKFADIVHSLTELISVLK